MLGPYQFGQIYTGDCKELGKSIPDSSINLIFTDPPYPKEYLYLYKWLAEFSARVLKPEGFLMVYVGGYWKDEIMAYMRQELSYFWDYTVISNGDAPMIWPRSTVARAKSIICYRPKNGTGMPRTNVLGALWNVTKQKAYHEWGQSEDEARYYIDCFTQPGQVVLEPFTGGGTTLAVCKVLNRPCVGFEIDSATSEIACKRVDNIKQLVYQLSLGEEVNSTQLDLF